MDTICDVEIEEDEDEWEVEGMQVSSIPASQHTIGFDIREYDFLVAEYDELEHRN